MRFNNFHEWDVTPSQAIQIQKEYAGKVERDGTLRDVTAIAGVDIAFEGTTGFGAVVILTYPELQVLDQAVVEAPVPIPYIPGLLSFREIPIVLRAFEKIREMPDVIFVDGQGTLHPRRFGIACHLGLTLDVPTVGCAKSLLCGSYPEPGPEKGDYSFVEHKNDRIGVALRTRTRTKEIFVSVGHKISIENAIELTLSISPKYRIPEPTRHADRLAGEYKRNRKPTAH